jgi:3-oxoadipate enol-lactonase
VKEAMKITANGIEINYEIAGPEGAPWLTFSNSLVCSLEMWDEQAARFAGRYRVLRYDLRGHGKSSAPSAPYAMRDLEDDVVALWMLLGIERSHWIGLSLGGMIGIGLALRYPDRIATLVASDCRAEANEAYAKVFEDRIKLTREQGMEALVEPTIMRFFTEPFRAAHPEIIDRHAEMIRNTIAEGHIGCCEAIRGLAYGSRLHELKAPTKFMGGEHDIGAPVAMMQSMHAALPGSQYETIMGAGHISCAEKPDEYFRAADRFISAHSKA